MTTLEQIAARYPLSVSLKSGGTAGLRLMGPPDRDAVLAFARSLPPDDLLFLRSDITEPVVVDEWLANIERGHTMSLVAYDGEHCAGYATVYRNPTRWTRRVGEIRLNVGPDYRRQGLGRNLSAHIFDVARLLGLKKLMANMTTDQPGAQQTFRRLGFVPEALLADYVEDRDGNARDLVIMSYDLDGLTDRVEEPLALQ